MQSYSLSTLVFALIAALGVAVSAIARDYSFQQPAPNPTDRTWYHFEITEVQYSGWSGKHLVSIHPQRKTDMAVIKQEALGSMAIAAGNGSSTNFVIGYLAPEAVDGQLVDCDAEIKTLPRPRFWQAEYRKWSLGVACNVMVEVTLNASGKVSNVERVGSEGAGCEKTSDVIAAANNIKFIPASRAGLPITQKQLFLYRLH